VAYLKDDINNGYEFRSPSIGQHCSFLQLGHVRWCQSLHCRLTISTTCSLTISSIVHVVSALGSAVSPAMNIICRK
jgi:hypothetical protein